ncbi:MAG: prolyl oligopeptidase family serine peptidase [Alphaproteobacteria bacterium]|nr:prolyl oligopeptidase family serine peptidase [Alphaproteobacteria bacterium]
MWALALLLSCSRGPKTDDTAQDPDDTDLTDDSGATDDTGAAQGDLALFQETLDGQRSVADLLLTVALSDGWPIDGGDGTWIFVAPDRGEDSVALAGDHSDWQPAAMTREAGLWWIRVAIEAPEGSLYKLVRGAAWDADPWSRAYGYDENGEHSLVRGGGAHLERWPEQGDANVGPRTVRVWVPRRAATHLLYAHDGQNLFAPDAIWGGWRLDESLGPATMVVAIDNTAARMDEYTHVQDYVFDAWMGGQGDAYADFVRDTVRPLVAERYGEPDTVGVMGSSLGGLISLHLALRDPEGYDFAASLSGTVGWGSIGADNETMIERYVDAGPFGVPIYLDSGGGPGSGCVDTDGDGIEDDSPDSSDNFCETRQMADAMAAAGWVWEQDLWHWWEEGEPHNEAAWAARVWVPLSLFEAM